MPLISVIVPVYNVEKYLSRCIDSILAQTFTDFELLLIDDGSKDKSGEICDEYALKDNRIRVFHKENGGVSSARNIGLDNAMGEWICFCDSDDYVRSDYLLTFMNLDMTTDLLSQGFYSENWMNSIPKTITQKEGIYYDQECFQLILDMYKSTHLGYLWCKAFKKYIICDNNIKFDEGFKHMEDLDFILKYCLRVRSIANSSKANYEYRYIYKSSEQYGEDDFKIYMNQYILLLKIANIYRSKDDVKLLLFDNIAYSLLSCLNKRSYKEHLSYLKFYIDNFTDVLYVNSNQPKIVRLFISLSCFRNIYYLYIITIVLHSINKLMLLIK